MCHEHSSDNPSTFVVTVDTEADNEWERHTEPTYENIRVLGAFQELCDEYDIRPTYLVTYDTAADPDSQRALQELWEDGNCEIGAHTHGWRTPPFDPAFDAAKLYAPFIYDYPRDLQARKIAALTGQLEQLFQTKMTSHRAGRWGIDAYTLRLLEANGYEVDTSVTPLRSTRHKKVVPGGKPGPDFGQAPWCPYFPAREDVGRPGNSKILEVPVSIRIFSPVLRVSWGRRFAWLFSGGGFTKRKIRAVVRRLGLAGQISLNPATNASRHMIQLIVELIRQNEPVLNMALHSSELIAGSSPNVVSRRDEQRVWRALEEVFACVSDSGNVRKQTLTEYTRQYVLTYRKGGC